MSQTVVMKFGGTSVGTAERISAVAERVANHIARTGDKVVVVVSAMSGETNRLIKLCKEVTTGEIPAREYNQVLTSGEQVSSALLSMAIQNQGLKSHSLLAHQVKVTTENIFGQDLIASIETTKIEELLADGAVPVIAGFQGINQAGDFTTLGRGGTDTTAVAIAAALGNNCRCMILTDVDGVYSALPSICPNAQKRKNLTFEEMLEMASAGAKILQTRSVSLAKKYKVPLFVGLSSEELEGTEIVEEYNAMEDAVVSAVSCRTDEAKITLEEIPNRPGLASLIFNAVAEAGVVVDMIVQYQGSSGHSGLSFTIPREELGRAEKAIENLVANEIPGTRITIDRAIAKLSVVGEGMRTHAGVAAQMFEVLGKEGVNIEMITTSEIKISVAIHEEYAEQAVRALHECFIENPNQTA